MHLLFFCSFVLYSLAMEILQDLILHTKILKPNLFCYKQLIECAMLSISDRTVAKSAMLDLSRQYFSQNRTHLTTIDILAQTYQSTQAALWYTKESFIHRITNKVLRTGNIEDCCLLRFYISHLSEQLHQLKCQQQKNVTETQKNTILYRGLRQSKAHLDILHNLVGHAILVKGFMSTSRDNRIALCYAGSEHPQSLQSQPLLIEICVDMTAPDIIAADIAHLSNFPEEREVLFDIGSPFRVESLNYDSSNLIWHCRLVAISNKSQVTQLSQHISFDESCINSSTYSTEEAKLEKLMCRERRENFRSIFNDQETDSLWRESPSMFWIATSSVDKALIFHQIALVHWQRYSDIRQTHSEFSHAWELLKQGIGDTSIENNDTACFLNNLGFISYCLGETEFGISLIKRAVAIRDRVGASAHFRAQSLRNLGLAYTDLGDYKNALASFHEALLIGQQARPTTQWSTSLTLRNFGYFYHIRGDYFQAALCFFKALETFRQCENLYLCIESNKT
jgi:hypothetical protein